MKIHVVQREGTRYFSRFSDLSERDRLVVELRIEDKNGGTISIDLTEALIGEYSKHPQIGKVSVPGPVGEIMSLQPIRPLMPKRSKTVSPIDHADPRRADILSRVREAQLKAVEEKKQRQAEQAAARAERLAAAREAKAKKQRAESRAQRAGKQKAEGREQRAESRAQTAKTQRTEFKGQRAKTQKSEARLQKVKSAPAPKAKKPAPQPKQQKPSTSPATTKATAVTPAKAEPAQLTLTQATAINKIGKVLAKEDRSKPRTPSAPKPKPPARPAPRSTRTRP
jgi:hypothetical protein